jgi:hypothetical protein
LTTWVLNVARSEPSALHLALWSLTNVFLGIEKSRDGSPNSRLERSVAAVGDSVTHGGCCTWMMCREGSERNEGEDTRRETSYSSSITRHSRKRSERVSGNRPDGAGRSDVAATAGRVPTWHSSGPTQEARAVMYPFVSYIC